MERNKKNTIYVNESGLYSLILRSKLEFAQVFERWVTKEVLPFIRRTGKCSYDDMNHKYNDSLTLKIDNELDLHIKVVSFLKKRYPNSIFTAPVGENQDTSEKRIVSDQKSYLSGSPNLIINNLRQDHTGFALSSRIQKELMFCHMISLRCCDSMKAMALRLSLVMTMAI